LEDVGYRVKENTYTNAASTKRPLASAPNYKGALEQMTTSLSVTTSKQVLNLFAPVKYAARKTFQQS
jgi:hypothetical protein